MSKVFGNLLTLVTKVILFLTLFKNVKYIKHIQNQANYIKVNLERVVKKNYILL